MRDADGAVAMPENFHVHLHVFTRFGGDYFGWKFGPTYFNKPDRQELDAIAQKIRSML